MNLEKDEEPIWPLEWLRKWLKSEVEARSLVSTVTLEIQNLLDQSKRAGIRLGKIGTTSGRLAEFLERGYRNAAEQEMNEYRRKRYLALASIIYQKRLYAVRFTPAKLTTLLLACSATPRKAEEG